MRGPAWQSNGFLSTLNGSNRDHTVVRVSRARGGLGRLSADVRKTDEKNAAFTYWRRMEGSENV